MIAAAIRAGHRFDYDLSYDPHDAVVRIAFGATRSWPNSVSQVLVKQQSGCWNWPGSIVSSSL
jgi:hypothetical protein